LKTRRLLSITVLAALASIVALSIPTTAAANPPKLCSLKNIQGVRTPTVKVRIRVRNLQQGTYWTAKCKTARRLVNVSTLKSPVKTHFVNSGFACNSEKLSEGGLDQRWRCKYRGADNPSFSKVAFNLHLHS